MNKDSTNLLPLVVVLYGRLAVRLFRYLWRGSVHRAIDVYLLQASRLRFVEQALVVLFPQLLQPHFPFWTLVCHALRDSVYQSLHWKPVVLVLRVPPMVFSPRGQGVQPHWLLFVLVLRPPQAILLLGSQAACLYQKLLSGLLRDPRHGHLSWRLLSEPSKTLRPD